VPGISVQTELTPVPLKVGPAKVEITLAGGTAQPITHADIKVEADMTHPGMSPVFGQATELAPGRYEAPIIFSMGGDWVIVLHIKTREGKTFNHQVDVPGVQSN
jgi:hypothetical protein